MTEQASPHPDDFAKLIRLVWVFERFVAAIRLMMDLRREEGSVVADRAGWEAELTDGFPEQTRVEIMDQMERESRMVEWPRPIQILLADLRRQMVTIRSHYWPVTAVVDAARTAANLRDLVRDHGYADLTTAEEPPPWTMLESMAELFRGGGDEHRAVLVEPPEANIANTLARADVDTSTLRVDPHAGELGTMPTADAPPDDLVTLDQAAAIVGRSKRTLERYMNQADWPDPDIPGGGGKPHRWYWTNLRPVLLQFRPDLPKRFPASRFIG